MRLRSRPLSRPVSRATPQPGRLGQGSIVARCWRARISVGAMIAACRPASIDRRHRRAAPTTVLPEPTSPCRRRSMRSARGEVGADIGQRLRLAARSARRAGRPRSGLAIRAVAAIDAPAEPLHLGPDHAAARAARPGARRRPSRLRAARPVRSRLDPSGAMDRQEARRESSASRARAKPGRILPFRQVRQAVQSRRRIAAAGCGRRAPRSSDRSARSRAGRAAPASSTIRSG